MSSPFAWPRLADEEVEHLYEASPPPPLSPAATTRSPTSALRLPLFATPKEPLSGADSATPALARHAPPPACRTPPGVEWLVTPQTAAPVPLAWSQGGRWPACSRLAASAFQLSCSAYFWSSVVYLACTAQTVRVDLCGLEVGAPAGSVLPLWLARSACRHDGDAATNEQYVALAAVHLANSLMFVVAWGPWMASVGATKRRRFRLAIWLPELLNVLEAALYVRSASQYSPAAGDPACDPDQGGSYGCQAVMDIHRMELLGSALELAAACLWAWVWWATHPRGRGRGLTLWDVDLYSSALLIAAAAISVTWNVQLLARPAEWGDNVLYLHADAMFCAGGVLYLAGAMRDCDAFWWLPLPGWPAQSAHEPQEAEPPSPRTPLVLAPPVTPPGRGRGGLLRWGRGSGRTPAEECSTV